MTIHSTLYPNASVSKAGTVSENNGSRSPVTKVNNGDAVVFIVKNGLNSSYGGNWLVTVSIALTSEAARISAPGTGENTTQHVIDGVTYWIAYQTTNANYGHGTEVINPLGLPVLQDYYICDVNSSPTTARVAQIISDLDITTQSSEVGGSVYIGDNSNTPSKVIALHIGDADNRPRKIIKGWIGDSDNKPRLFWGGGELQIFENGIFNNVPNGTNLNNNTPIFRYSSSTLPYDQMSAYYTTNKCILLVYNSNLDYQYMLDNNNDITLSLTGAYGPNYNVYIPIKRIVGYSQLKIIAKGTNTRLYVYGRYYKPNDNALYTNGNSGLIRLTNDYTEYTIELNKTQYIDYISFLTEQGKPYIKKIWIKE